MNGRERTRCAGRRELVEGFRRETEAGAIELTVLPESIRRLRTELKRKDIAERLKRALARAAGSHS